MRASTDDRATGERRGSGKAATAAAGFCAGAAVAYLFDPVRGRSRRARGRDKAAHATHKVRDGLGVLSRDLANRGRGLGAAVRYRYRGHSVDDRVLHERVRAELGRHVSHPHAVEVQVHDRIVTLAGDVLAVEDERTRKAIRRVPGVRRVEATWTTHIEGGGTPRLRGGRLRRPVPELLQMRWSPTARFLAGATAAVLWTLRLPAPFATAARGLAGVLAVRAATNLPLRRLTGINAGRRGIDVTAAVTVNAPPDAVWDLVSDYSAFPNFMPNVYEVRLSADGRTSHWLVSGPGGTPVRFDASETRRVEGRELAWKSAEGELIAHAGTVRLAPVPGGRTQVQVRLTYNPVAGAAGHVVARLLGADPERRLRQNLSMLKTYAEHPALPHTVGV
ncbi:Polyketide cyclase / dehydrase and lipid transport [Nonomuraea coxensis DSM 45129]|uniref:Polyketide cyclase / dehydrase and lipid transport n=1 Tax=Nonomuraea coxensis DSM 45129 TaxID=1122611 RepID=A0ABX8U3Z7_9ACTN|nr:SRPBCC family protein [Nonomuraea coxensis]QYC42471.1 Polyketide cyclase / dehydrase and lipid transport [Nonomuraea coxensis DSM 45129]